ncbi:hypothetical protein N5B55_04855 [Ralstonia pickettii]|uniref:hypothetical protein n=1 Tax=Ralstonia pickettii TaxID=329 RepID=UPI0027145029|nr:hypothetical protein [Ralstonia pickettii]WKZ86283.1 hypothetical protein N5B55_04855 [Ralstonia pickettii]
MILRAVFLALLLMALIYGVLWLATCTPFFKDKARIRRIIRRTFLTAASACLTVLAMAFLISVDHIM